MKTPVVFLAIGAVLTFLVSSATAVPATLTWLHEDGQDNNLNEVPHHELGDGFPIEDLIESWHQDTAYRPCYENPDDPGIPNIEVSITNLTNRSWWDLQYVTDPETSIQNYDEWRINAEEAFLIDYGGANTPLISESMLSDLIFQPGETWVFVIQDYVNGPGGLPTPFDSYDAINNVGQVGNQSPGWPPSTGSIIAVPEPGTVGLLAFGALAVLRRRNG